MRHASRVAALVAALLSGCAAIETTPPAPVQSVTRGTTVAPASASASETAVCAPCNCPRCPEPGVTPEPALPPARLLQPAAWADLPGWRDDDQAAAWPAFRLSCRGLRSRPLWAQWQAVCEAAEDLGATPSAASVRQFLESRLTPYTVNNADSSQEGLITGYYEPLLRGSRTRKAPYLHPIHGVPDDLLTIDLGDLLPELKDKRVRGRLVGNKVVPYYSRAELRGRESTLQGKALVYVDDPIELFFLQIQGSGRVRLPDGSLLRVGYADQNGHPYQSIGRVLIERGELKAENASMQGIQAWARANPKKLDELLDANPSYVFFRLLPTASGKTEDGPLGALGVPLTAGRSLAIDPRSVPLGAPVYLATTQPNASAQLNRLMLAQDTGGAIKGAVRADFFWGFGAEAGQQAGRMKQRGRLWLLWPRDVALPGR